MIMNLYNRIPLHSPDIIQDIKMIVNTILEDWNNKNIKGMYGETFKGHQTAQTQ